MSKPILVNYTSVPTSVPNEMYVASTDSPESLATLMRNVTTIEVSLVPIYERKVENDELKTSKIV